MPVSSSSQRNLKILKLPFLTLNLSLKLKEIMQRLELKTQMISRKSSMPNGKSFMISLIESSRPERRLFFQACLLAISRLNTSLTEMFSVLVEFKKMIFKELPKLLVLSFKPLLRVLPKMFLVLVVNSKKFN